MSITYSSSNTNTTLTGPPPDITETLNLRKTPRLPAKIATPRHTNIGGSPVRHSSVRPDNPRSPLPPLSAQPDRANRKLDFTRDPNPVASTSLNPIPVAPNSRKPNPVSPSPFKPRPGKSRKSIFNFDDSPAKPQEAGRASSADLEQALQHAQDAISGLDQSEDEIVTVQLNHVPKPTTTDTLAAVLASSQSSNQKRKREQVRADDHLAQDSPSRPNLQSAQKRRKSHPAPDVTIIDAADTTHADHTVLDATEYTTADPTEYTTVDRTEYTTADPTEFTEADPTEYTVADQTQYTVADHTEYTAADPTEYTLADPTEYTQQSIEESHMPDDAAAGADATTISVTVEANPIDEMTDEEQLPDQADDISEPEEYLPPPEADHDEQVDQVEQPQKRGKGRPKGRKAAPKQAVQKKPAQPRATIDRDTQSVDPDGTKKHGPKSLVALRAGTPQDDEGATQTRSGRTSIKPLKYWCNESFIWKHGEVDGVVRAEELSNPKPLSRARGKPKKKQSALGAIREDEEDEDEDLLPEAWEEELGVINSSVRTWDAQTGMGNPEDGIHEGMLFLVTAFCSTNLTNPYSSRYRICIKLHRPARRPRPQLQIRQNHEPVLLRCGPGRGPTRGP